MLSRRVATSRSKNVKRAPNTARRPPVEPPRAPAETTAAALPSLQVALRLYVLVLLACAILVVGELPHVDAFFLYISAGLFVFSGFTIVALLVTKTSVDAIFGTLGRQARRIPLIFALVISFLAGVTIWVPTSWSLFVLRQTLGAAFGNPPAQPGTKAPFVTQALVEVGLIPFSEGFLFFGFILSAARGLGNWRGVWLTAALFGLFGLFVDRYGLSAMPAYFALGLVGGALTLWSGSAWAGIMVLVSFNLAEPLIITPTHMLSRLLTDQANDVLSGAWVVTAVLFALFTLALTQLARAYRTRQPLPSAAKPGQAWWLPLVIVVVLGLLVGNNEIQTRRQNYTAPVIVTPTPAPGAAQPVDAPNAAPTATP